MPEAKLATVHVATSDAETGPVTRRMLRKQELRARISAAATELFAGKGINDTTIDEICESAGVSRRTLYAYFPTKQDLVRSLCQSLIIEETIAVVEQAIRAHADVASRLRFLFRDMQQRMNQAQELQKELTRQLVSDQGKDVARDSAIRGDLRRAYVTLFETAEGIQSLGRGMSADLSASILFSMISLLSINWINDASYPLAENIAAVETYLVGNLC